MPNDISYNATGQIQGWGYAIKFGQQRLARLDLLLSPSTTNERNKLIPDSKRPVDVIIDYLSCLRKHVIGRLSSFFGEPFLGITPMDWVLVVHEVCISFPSKIVSASQLLVFECRIFLSITCCLPDVPIPMRLTTVSPFFVASTVLIFPHTFIVLRASVSLI